MLEGENVSKRVIDKYEQLLEDSPIICQLQLARVSAGFNTHEMAKRLGWDEEVLVAFENKTDDQVRVDECVDYISAL